MAETSTAKNLTVPNVLPPGSNVSSVSSESPRMTAAEALQKAQTNSAGKPKRLRPRRPTNFNHPPFPVYEPYADPVDLAELLDTISLTILRFVIVDKEQADTAALWIAHTYVADLFDVSPLAIINAPERACAKTLFQTVLAKMSFRPLQASNATASALFRSVEIWMPSIFFDEADTFFKDSQDLIGMVNAGYNAGGFVLRSESNGESFIPTKFSVHSPKSIAGIALDRHLPDSTLSRGIVFNMRRKLPHESVERMRFAEKGLFPQLASKLERFSLDYADKLKQSRPALPEQLSDRGQDNWEPLLAIAICANEDWGTRATAAALSMSKASKESVSTGNELLADIQQVFESRRDGSYADKISTKDLIAELIEFEESPWATYNHGRPISPKQLVSQLARYEIHSKTVRVSKYETPKGYALEQFTEAFARYLSKTEAEDEVPPEDETVDDNEPLHLHLEGDGY
jgi:putative DNA primase/helicase